MLINIFIIIALIGIAIGSYTDIKTLEVPDWLSYSLIAIGIAGNLVYTIANSDPLFIIRSLLGLGLSILLGLAMFYTGQWGGGDSKVLFGLGALLGIDLPFRFGLLIKFLINILFAGALYGILWIIVLAAKNRKKVMLALKKSYTDKKYEKIRLYSGIACIASLIVIYLLPPVFDAQIKLIVTIFIVILYFMNHLVVVVKAVENAAMVREVPPEKLTEGDWIVDEIKIDGKYIAGPKDLGIDKSKIKELILLKKQKKISKIKVKYGIPFVPSFLIALVYTVITNNIIILQLL